MESPRPLIPLAESLQLAGVLMGKRPGIWDDGDQMGSDQLQGMGISEYLESLAMLRKA